VPLTLLAINGARALKNSLMRGFTSVRDTAGGDFGIKAAVERGLIDAPRLFISGQALSQTGGHGDFRKRTQSGLGCDCCSGLAYTARIADGVPEVIKATRDELRKGADFIKIMVSGGVASQADPLDSLQYRMDEIQAAVEEATNWGKYVAAHAYSSQAVMRAVSAGVRTIEHGNLIDEPTAATMARKGAFLVPTLIAYDSMRRRGREYGLSEYSLQKNEVVLAAGLRSVELARNAGVKIGFGTDLLGQLQDDQSREFLIRAELMKPAQIIHSATIVNAEILQREGELGELKPGAYADLLVVDGDPLADLNLFQDEGRHLSAIMKGGRFYKNRLAP
jgi:imidazolonepropionase-like amidohydrolase